MINPAAQLALVIQTLAPSHSRCCRTPCNSQAEGILSPYISAGDCCAACRRGRLCFLLTQPWRRASGWYCCTHRPKDLDVATVHVADQRLLRCGKLIGPQKA